MTCSTHTRTVTCSSGNLSSTHTHSRHQSVTVNRSHSLVRRSPNELSVYSILRQYGSIKLQRFAPYKFSICLRQSDVGHELHRSVVFQFPVVQTRPVFTYRLVFVNTYLESSVLTHLTFERVLVISCIEPRISCVHVVWSIIERFFLWNIYRVGTTAIVRLRQTR